MTAVMVRCMRWRRFWTRELRKGRQNIWSNGRVSLSVCEVLCSRYIRWCHRLRGRSREHLGAHRQPGLWGQNSGLREETEGNLSLYLTTFIKFFHKNWNLLRMVHQIRYKRSPYHPMFDYNLFLSFHNINIIKHSRITMYFKSLFLEY